MHERQAVKFHSDLVAAAPGKRPPLHRLNSLVSTSLRSYRCFTARYPYFDFVASKLPQTEKRLAP